MFFSFQNLTNLIIIILSTICLLIIIAFYTVAERKIMAAIQRRQGPHKVGFLGLLQAFADALKLLAKELLIPLKTGKVIFICAPWIILALSLLNWSVIPLKHNNFFANINYSINFILAISSLNVYCIIMAGWSSNSKYSFFGAIRSVSQMLSYEVVISVVILCILLISNSLNFVWINILQYKTIIFVLPLILIFIVFLIIILAETNRTPFDLPEAEAELVAGYNLEYSSIIFALFFLAEYANMLLMSVITILFFFGYNVTTYDLFQDFINWWNPSDYFYKAFSDYIPEWATSRMHDLILRIIISFIYDWGIPKNKEIYPFLLILASNFVDIDSINMLRFDGILTSHIEYCFYSFGWDWWYLEIQKPFGLKIFSYPNYELYPRPYNAYFWESYFTHLLCFVCDWAYKCYLFTKVDVKWYYIYCFCWLPMISFVTLIEYIFFSFCTIMTMIPNIKLFILSLFWFITYSFSFILILLCCIYFIVIRATLPRYRYDHLLMITWKCIMPLTFGILLILIKLLM